MHPLASLRNTYPNGICMARLRCAIGMVLGAYVMDTNITEGILATQPGVIWLAKNIGDRYDAIRTNCRIHNVRLNDIYGNKLP